METHAYEKCRLLGIGSSHELRSECSIIFIVVYTKVSVCDRSSRQVVCGNDIVRERANIKIRLLVGAIEIEVILVLWQPT